MPLKFYYLFKGAIDFMTTNSLKYTQSPEEFDGILEAVRQARTLLYRKENR